MDPSAGDAAAREIAALLHALVRARTLESVATAWRAYGPSLAARGPCARRLAQDLLAARAARLLAMPDGPPLRRLVGGVARAQHAALEAVRAAGPDAGRDFDAARARAFCGPHDGPAWRQHLATRANAPHAIRSLLTRRVAFLAAGVYAARLADARRAIARHMAAATPAPGRRAGVSFASVDRAIATMGRREVAA